MPLKLIEDLGTRRVGAAGKKRGYGLYECPVCTITFEASTYRVTSGRTTMCPACIIKRNAKILIQKASSIFIDKSREVHGYKYDYSKVDYIGALDKIIIVCPKHGEFLQTPADHKSGYGCPNCHKVSYAEFLERAALVHENKYDYSLVEYHGTIGKVSIICPEHGVFLQTPSNHMKGKGCPKCNRLSTKEFINRAVVIHGNTYDYTSTIVVNVKQKVEIRCNHHGVFLQLPGHHTSGQGCPLCSVSGFDSSKPALLYYLKVTSSSDVLYKIGITNLTLKDRFRLRDLEKIQVLKIWEFPLGADAYNKEQETLKQFREFKYTGDPILSSGNTELFTVDVLQLDKEKD